MYTLGPAQNESYNRMKLIGELGGGGNKNQNTYTFYKSYKLCMYVIIIYEKEKCVIFVCFEWRSNIIAINVKCDELHTRTYTHYKAWIEYQ